MSIRALTKHVVQVARDFADDKATIGDVCNAVNALREFERMRKTEESRKREFDRKQIDAFQENPSN